MSRAYLRKPRKTRIISVANQKGGVGKTTTAVNMATALSAVGRTVLIMDMDPQGNASTGLGVPRSGRELNMYEVIFGECAIEQAIYETRVPRLDIVPGSVHLAGAELELVTVENREFKLKEAVARSTLPYDYIIIDCPPSLSLLTLNALVASQSVLVPLQCEFYALEGLAHLTRTIEKVQAHFNDDLDLLGIILTMHDRRNNLSNLVAGDVREHFGDLVFQTQIPRNVRVSEAPSFGLPAIVYDMRCPGSQAYIKLAKELIQRERAWAKDHAAA